MTNTILPEQGDVISSRDFAYGEYHWGDRSKPIKPGGTSKKVTRSERISEDERIQIALETGTTPPTSRTVDDSAYDPTRATAKFVVIGARMQGGSESQGYPDGWHVTARRLNDDETYTPDGELLEFYMSPNYSGSIMPDQIEIHGKKTLMYV